VVELATWNKDAAGHRDPSLYMLPEGPAAKKQKDCKTADEWDAHKLRVQAHQEAVAAAKASEAYMAQKARHDAYVAAKRAVAASFFKDLPSKKGWTFDCSVATDGVSISLQYSKLVQVPMAAKKKKAKVAEADAPAVATTYDRNLQTYLPERGMAVLGVDPGRSNLAAVTYLVAGGSRTWTLTRGAFYQRSGVKKLGRQQADRSADLAPKWASLGGEGVALSTSRPSELLAYLAAYSAFSDEWWRRALQRRESRDNLQRYIGKRKVMDTFWASIRKSFQKTHPGVTAHMAYGSAITTMKATGPGEAAVPTGAMFASCKRVFKEQVAVVDEFRSTLMGWETGAKKEMVYKVPSLAVDATGRVVLGKERLRHSAAKKPPVVAATDALAVQVYNARKEAQGKHRRGGLVDDDVGLHKNKSTQRYPEVRGLRFSPESSMYFDRDRSAALTIARLRCMELKGLGRPLPFDRSFAL
jgi:hypothetical protein